MNCRRQARSLYLDPVVVVVIHVFDQFLFEVFHGLELLQIQQLTFEQPKEIFYHQFFEFWRISFVCYSFWHSKTPHLLDSISYCLTNGVQFSSAPRLSVYSRFSASSRSRTPRRSFASRRNSTTPSTSPTPAPMIVPCVAAFMSWPIISPIIRPTSR